MKKWFPLALLMVVVGCKNEPAKNSETVVRAATTSLRWTITDSGTAVLKYPHPENGSLVVDGFWVPTSAERGKLLPFPMAVEITCDRTDGLCREIQANVSFGILAPSEELYIISSWNQTSVVADDRGSGMCNIGHRLTISLKAKSVIVVDYPTAPAPKDNKLCKALNDANSYVLHDGVIELSGPVPFDQSNVKK